MVAKKRRVKREKGNSITFRGTRYWFYEDHFFRYRGKLEHYLKKALAELHKQGYKTHIVRPSLSWNIIEIYTNPRVPGRHIKRF